MTKILLSILNELTKLNCNIRPPTTNESQYLTIERVAKEMDCSENTVRNWIKEGQLKTFQYKGTLRIRTISLERFITKYTG